MKKLGFIRLIVFWAIGLSAWAQDDDMEKLLNQGLAQNTDYTFATFKSTRIVGGHSVENVAAKHLDFRISHRFGRLNQDHFYDMFGLDQATIRLGLEYGVTDWLMVGLGRSSLEKTYDGFVKAKLLRQSKGKKNMPLTLSVFGSTVVKTERWTNPDRENYFSSRLFYTFQALMARKFNERFSLQLTPTVIHRNLVARIDDHNTIFALGLGGRLKLSKRVSLNAEYFWLVPGQLAQTTTDALSNALSIGFDIETGGHVFQLHFTNTRAMVEKGFIAETDYKWEKGDICFGFNISRTFSFDRKSTKKTEDKKW